MVTSKERLTNPEGSKPDSLSSTLEFAHKRIDILRQVCQGLVMETDPQRRASLLAMVALAARVGDVESDGGSDGS